MVVPVIQIWFQIQIYKLQAYKARLSSLSKVLEKIIAQQIFWYLKKYKLLYSHQYGFRPGHDTEQPILQILDKIYSCLNETNNPDYVLGIFLDRKKAFDTVDYNSLLNKLEHHGFRGTTKNIVDHKPIS